MSFSVRAGKLTLMSSEKKQTPAGNHPPAENQEPENKTFRIVVMSFCLAVTLLFLWVWHHQTQFNDGYRKASFLMRNGDTAAAIEAYQEAIANKNRTLFFTKEPSAHNNLGQAYLQAGQYASAVASFKTVIEIAPGVAEGYVNLTTAYLRQNLLADARQLCLRALEMFPEVALLHYNLACAYALEADVPKAVASLTRAVALNPVLKTLAQEESALKGVVEELP